MLARLGLGAAGPRVDQIPIRGRETRDTRLRTIHVCQNNEPTQKKANFLKAAAASWP